MSFKKARAEHELALARARERETETAAAADTAAAEAVHRKTEFKATLLQAMEASATPNTNPTPVRTSTTQRMATPGAFVV